MSDRRVTTLIVLLLFFSYLLLTSLRIGSGDGETIYQVTRALVEGRGFALPPPPSDAVVVSPWGEPIPSQQLHGGGPYGAWGSDGRYYAQYGVGQSLLALPLYLLGRWVHRATGWGTEGLVTRAAVMLLNPIALALMGGLLYRLARRLGYGQTAALGVALVASLASPLWVYSKTFFSEPLVALALTLAVLSALRGAEGAWDGWAVCGVALGAAALVKPVALIVAPAFVAYALLRREGRWQALALVAAPLMVGVAGVAAYNLVRFGSMLDTGYRTAAWNIPPWVGLFGLLLSPGKGLFWYCPSVALGVVGFIPLMRRRPRAALLLGGTAGLYLLVHVTYNHWHGGGAWGPRLILPLLPLLLLPVARWFQSPPVSQWGQIALALLLAAGMVFQMPTILVHPARSLQSLYDRSASPVEYTMRMVYRPADSPLLSQWRSLLEVMALMREPVSRQALIEAARTTARGETDRWDSLTGTVNALAPNTFDLWSVYWRLLGAPLLPLLAVEGGLAAMAGWAVYSLRKRLT